MQGEAVLAERHVAVAVVAVAARRAAHEFGAQAEHEGVHVARSHQPHVVV